MCAPAIAKFSPDKPVVYGYQVEEVEATHFGWLRANIYDDLEPFCARDGR
jgi:hypothetical protein